MHLYNRYKYNKTLMHLYNNNNNKSLNSLLKLSALVRQIMLSLFNVYLPKKLEIIVDKTEVQY